MIVTSRNGVTTSLPVAASLDAETTKIIGTIKIAAGESVAVPLPADAATQTTLAAIKAKTDNLDVLLSLLATQATLAALLTELQAKADLSETQPISAATLPLPADAATQTTLALIKAKTDNLDAALSTLATQATLALIKAKTDNLDALLSSLATQATLAALLTELQAKADLVETQPVSGTFWQATQPVSGTFWQATQPVSGIFWQGTQPVSLAVAPTTPVTGTFWQATQPVSGTVTANPATSAGKTLTYVSVNQGAAGTTVLAAASVGNKHKVLGTVLTMSVLGTLKFTDTDGDRTGPMDVAATGGFVLPTAMLPYVETNVTNKALNLVTTLGAARGVVILLTEP